MPANEHLQPTEKSASINWIFDKACLGSVLPSQKCTFKIE